MRGSRAPVRTAVVLALAWSTDTAAQTEPSLDVRTWRPSIDADASLVLEPPSTPGPGRWSLSAWSHFAGDPVSLSGDGPPRPLAYTVGADIVAGIGIGKRLAFGVDLPTFAWQTGTGSLPASVVSGGAVATSGIGDVELRAKMTLVSDDRLGTHVGFGLATLAGVSLPTGDKANFTGDGDVAGWLALLTGYTVGPASMRASAGYAMRASEHAWPDSGAFGGPTFGASVPWAVGVTLRPKAVSPSIDRADRQEWELALHGALPAGPVAPIVGQGAAALSPALVAIDDRVGLGHYHDAYFVGGVDVGLDRAIGVPIVRGVLAIGFAPRSHDKDDDGVDDDVDQCPELAEDRDGVQDADGCPEDDAAGGTR